MKKGCNILCLLILVAFGLLAEAPSATEAARLDKAKFASITTEISEKSYVVIGSITNTILGDGQWNRPTCRVARKADYSNIVVPLSKQHGLDWRLVTAIMAAESSFNPCAVSPKGAMGLMQIMPAVAKEYEVSPNEAFDPDENVRAGILLLKRLNKRYKGNLKLTVAAYNAGEGNVARYGGIPPFDETRNYVKRVLGYHSDLKVAKAKPMGGSPLKLLKAR
jgi:soluble lytic murein transglycosylase-like protein